MRTIQIFPGLLYDTDDGKIEIVQFPNELFGIAYLDEFISTPAIRIEFKSYNDKWQFTEQELKNYLQEQNADRIDLCNEKLPLYMHSLCIRFNRDKDCPFINRDLNK